MLVIPIINEGRILNVSIKLSRCKKIESTDSFLDSGASNIIINKKYFSDSSYYTQKIEPRLLVDFIHHNNMYAQALEFYVTTKKESISNKFDVYEVEVTELKINNALDNLFGECIIDLCNENPDVNYKKGRNISLERFGIANHITPERLSKLKYLAENLSSINARNYIIDNGLQDLIDTIEFLDLFDCTVIPKSAISCEKIEAMLKSLEKTSTNLYKELKKYYDMARENQEVYSKIASLYHIVYNKPYTWIHNENIKIKQKTTDEVLKGSDVI